MKHDVRLAEKTKTVMKQGQVVIRSLVFGVSAFFGAIFLVSMVGGALWSPEDAMSNPLGSMLLHHCLPPLAAGYLTGRLARRDGVLLGLVTAVLALAVFHLLLFPFPADDDLTSPVMQALLCALAGGVGELHALRKTGA